MSEYRRVESSLEIPRNAGTAGFMRTLETLIKLPRVQSITVDARGKVTWTRYVRDDENEPLAVQFDDLEPWAVIRNGELMELNVNIDDAALVLIMMLDRVTSEGLHPTAFVSGAATIFWDWFASSTGYRFPSQHVMGLPLYLDRHAPDTALILGAAYEAGASLADTHKSYKIEMDYVVAPETHVEVFGDG